MKGSKAVSAARDRIADTRDKAIDAINAPTQTTATAASHLGSTASTAVFTAILGITAMSQPALAQPEGCTVPADLQPVFDLLNAITQAAAAIGIVGATLGIVIAGIFYMWPGADMNRRAKSIILTTVGGVAIILLANAIISFVTTNIGNTVCSGTAATALSAVISLL